VVEGMLATVLAWRIVGSVCLVDEDVVLLMVGCVVSCMVCCSDVVRWYV
jgi:hypothetical protein